MDQIIRGQYQVLEKLGSGGMGDVLKAKDLKLNRLVALKFLKADHGSDPTRRQRFLLEAQAASALNHPNIITIHDIISEDDAEIMVMEMVAGRTLDDLIPRGGLRVSQIINYSAQVADALAAAHAAGIIHRDLKPGNVMVTDRDLVKLLDFGLAKLAPGAFGEDPDATAVTPLTVQGTIVGTLCYMSPEQAQGKASDARSDIFSFGAVLYEMATGNRAFTGDNAVSTLTSVLRDEPRRVLEISPEVPAVLSDVIHQCMRKDPDDRFQNMAEVRDALIRLRQLSQSGALYAQSPLASGIMSPQPIAATPTVSSTATEAPKATAAEATAVAPPKAAKASKAAAPKAVAGATTGTPAWMWPAVGAAALVLLAGGWWLSRDTTVAVPESTAVEATPSPTPDPNIETTPDPSAAVTPATTSATDATRRTPPATAAKPTASGARAATAATAAPAKEAVVLLVSVPDALPIAMELVTEIPVGAETGMPLQFIVTSDLKVGEELVVAKGALATGEIYAADKKRGILGIGGGSKVSIQLTSVQTIDGSRINIRATAGPGDDSNRTIEKKSQDSKTVIVAKGATTIGYTSGQQTVRLKK